MREEQEQSRATQFVCMRNASETYKFKWKTNENFGLTFFLYNRPYISQLIDNLFWHLSCKKEERKRENHGNMPPNYSYNTKSLLQLYLTNIREALNLAMHEISNRLSTCENCLQSIEKDKFYTYCVLIK